MATVRQALDQEDQMPVTDLQGTITKVSERKSGEGKYGEWSLQFLTMEDGSDSIPVMAKNRDEDFSELQGKRVSISAVKSKQHGWVGAESFDNEYKGEVQRVVKLTPAGQIEEVGNSGSSKQKSSQPENGKGKMDLESYLDVLSRVHHRCRSIEPNDAQAAAALANTAMIALTQNRVEIRNGEAPSEDNEQSKPESTNEQSLKTLREELGEHSLSEIQFLDYVNRKAGKEWGELDELPQAYISKALERFAQNGVEFQIEIMESVENA